MTAATRPQKVAAASRYRAIRDGLLPSPGPPSPLKQIVAFETDPARSRDGMGGCFLLKVITNA